MAVFNVAGTRVGVQVMPPGFTVPQSPSLLAPEPEVNLVVLVCVILVASLRTCM